MTTWDGEPKKPMKASVRVRMCVWGLSFGDETPESSRIDTLDSQT